MCLQLETYLYRVPAQARKKFSKKLGIKKLEMVNLLDRANPHLDIAIQIIPLQFS